MPHWTALAANPTDPVALEHRRQRVKRCAAASLIEDRIAYLCSLATGKRVLDVGVVDHTLRDPSDPSWLHGRLRRVAARCVGVDVLGPEVSRLRAQGFDVRFHDLTRGPLEENFDLIVLGEVLEHVESPLALLRSAAVMLDHGGSVVVTAPNPWYVATILRSVRRSTLYVDNADHCAWFDPCTMCELGDRVGLELYRYSGVRVRSARSYWARIFFGLHPLWVVLGVKPEFFAKTIVYEFRREELIRAFPSERPTF